jgi:zinc transporter ZupT
MDTIQLVSLLVVIGLVLAHLFSGRLRFLEGTPRSIWLSMAGGVSVAYVFVHLLPELAEAQDTIREALGEGLGFLENHVYLIALLGLAVFYGVERTSAESRKDRRGEVEAPADSYAASRTARRGAPIAEGGEESTTSAGVFWLSISSFAVYNVLVGYLLLHRIERGLGNLLLFGIAMLLHFIVNDFGLRERHREAYKRIGRWVLAGAVLLGWLIGLLAEIPEALIAVLTAFLAGGVVLNVLKEELPEERRSRYWPFALGAAGYAALLLAT